MREDVKNLWVEALRSGEYRQGVGRLAKKVDGRKEHCCLGVLCDLAVKAGVVFERETLPISSNPWYANYAFDESYEITLPEVVSEWAGLQDDNPSVEAALYKSEDDDDEYVPIDGEYSLAELNDSGNYTFEQIADLIETQL